MKEKNRTNKHFRKISLSKHKRTIKKLKKNGGNTIQKMNCSPFVKNVPEEKYKEAAFNAPLSPYVPVPQKVTLPILLPPLVI